MLTTRSIDFWLLGGASLLLWGFYLFFYFLTGNSSGPNFASAFGILSLFVNYPHFMASYKLAYQQDATFIRKNFIPLLLVPALLIVSISLGFYYFERSSFGIFDSKASFGVEVMWLLILLMNLTTGWHYTQQTYGCMITYAFFDRYRLNSTQCKWLKWSLYFLWFFSICDLMSPGGKLPDGTPVPFHIPDPIYLIFAVFSFISILGVIYFIFYKKFTTEQAVPSLCFVVPFISMYIWWITPTVNEKTNYSHSIPFFHSLQYLAFVYKVDSNTTQLKDSHFYRLLGVALSYVFFGYLSFLLVPSTLSYLSKMDQNSQIVFFPMCFASFINIHHFFIDSVLWKLKGPLVKEYILK